MTAAQLIGGQCLSLGHQASSGSPAALSQQWLSADAAGRLAAIKLGASVVTTSLLDITAQQQSLQAPLPQAAADPQQAAIRGVCVSPDGSFVAAYSSDTLFVADLRRADRQGHLQPAAQLPRVTAAHWCPAAAVLAAVCRQQSAIHLAIFQRQQEQQEPPPGLHLPPQLLLLPGPEGATTAAARSITWVPCDSSCAGLLAAWSTDALLYSWRSTAEAGGPDWRQHTVRRILTGWPGPARALATAQNGSSSSSHVVVLGTVDAQLSLASDGSQSVIGMAPANGSSSSGKQQGDQQLTISGPAEAAVGGLLGGLMNIASLQPGGEFGSLLSATAAAGSAATQHMGSACLCMLHISLHDGSSYRQATGSFAATSANPSSSNGAVAFTSVLPLPDVRLPNLLCVQQQTAVVASTRGVPVVVVAGISAATGLQLLQVLSLPLPAADPAYRSARLESLLLAPPATTAAAQPGEVLALLACSEQDTQHQPAGFAGFGSSKPAAAELCVVKYRLSQDRPGKGQGSQAAAETTPAEQQDEQHLREKPATAATQEQQQDGAVAAAIERLQSSMEQRLDALTSLMSRVVQRLEALEAGAATTAAGLQL